jgi:precorrin-3B synthase
MPTTVDACPGVLTLHPARDGHVARIRLPGGYVSGRQWTALAGLAGEFGDGGLDLTARGNVQLRGLSPAAAAAQAGAGAGRRYRGRPGAGGAARPVSVRGR